MKFLRACWGLVVAILIVMIAALITFPYNRSAARFISNGGTFIVMGAFAAWVKWVRDA